MADHRRDLTITEMVYNRLPFLAITEHNDLVISEFILEVMNELETCFKVDETRPDTETTTWIGWEDKYSIAQRVVIAEVVSVYILLLHTVSSTVGVADGTTDGTASPKFLKRTSAGSVEVEWEQLDYKKGSGLLSNSDKLIKLYQDAARRKAYAMGCSINWDNADMQADCLRCNTSPAGFIVVSDGCNDLDGITPKERV